MITSVFNFTFLELLHILLSFKIYVLPTWVVDSGFTWLTKKKKFYPKNFVYFFWTKKLFTSAWNNPFFTWRINFLRLPETVMNFLYFSSFLHLYEKVKLLHFRRVLNTALLIFMLAKLYIVFNLTEIYVKNFIVLFCC